MPEDKEYTGGCHCGAVRFTVNAPGTLAASRCNCSICAQTGFIHLIVTRDDFTLLQGRGDLSEYSFNTGTAKHLFCRHCGVKSFYIPRSHPNGYSVNVNCLDDVALADITITEFDGQNWEDAIEGLD
jgi:hypothetical protein